MAKTGAHRNTTHKKQPTPIPVNVVFFIEPPFWVRNINGKMGCANTPKFNKKNDLICQEFCGAIMETSRKPAPVKISNPTIKS
jgi:hypothetical protein